jgi:hypothetical protein
VWRHSSWRTATRYHARTSPSSRERYQTFVASSPVDRQPSPLVGRAGEATLSLGQPDIANDGSGYVRLPIYLEAGGLSAQTTIELENWDGGGSGLIAYFEDLAASWKGWQGSKQWHDDGPNVEIIATHDGIGTIAMEVSVAPFRGWDGPGSWTLRIVVPIDPGSLDSAVEKLLVLVKTST